MVRHGTLKKRRRGIKVRRNAPKNVNVRINNSVKDENVKKMWDKSKSPAENLISIGLDPDPNKSAGGVTTSGAFSTNELPNGFEGYLD